MKLSNKAIKEIAEILDCGMVCYIHKETHEIKSIIDPDNIYSEEEFWREDLDEIEKESDRYIKIDKMSSQDAFQVMEGFLEQVSNKEIRNRLVDALNRKGPFRNFKYEVDSNKEVRQHWFKYKAYKYEEWVKDYLESIADEERGNEESLGVMMFYDDDGNEYNPNLISLPNLCMSCKKKDDPNEELVCNLTRMDQHGEVEFKCFAYEKI